jgi:hypothetical protein
MPDLARERLGTGAFMSTVCTARALPWRETAQVARRLDGLALMQVQGMAHAHARRARHRLSNGRPLSGLASLSRCVVRHTLTRCPKNERYAIGIFSFPIRAYCGRMARAADPDPTRAKSPYAGLDYEPGCTPSTAALGPTAKAISEQFGVGPFAAWPAAILFDQGASSDALDLLHREVERLAVEREDAKDTARAKARQ